VAIAHRSTGAANFAANSVLINRGSPQEGDMMLMLVAGKPFDGDVSVDIAGWTELAAFTNGSVAAGVDVGSMQVTAFWKECSASESNPTLVEGTPAWNVFGGLIMSFSKDASETWETPLIVGGGDSSAGTGFSVTAGSNPGVTAGDVCVCFAGFRSDAATPCSTHLVATQTGVTFTNTHDPATDPETTSGGDMGMCVNRATVSGTGSAAPVLVATLAAAHTGAAAFIRLRAAVSGDVTVTPDPIALSVGMPAASPSVGATKTPDPVAVVASVPDVSESAGATKTPDPVATVVGAPQATPSAGATKVPATIAALLGLPQASPSAGVTKTPNTIPLATVLPQASAGVIAVATPDPVGLVAALPQAQPSAGATKTPSPVAVVVALPQVSPSAAAQVTPEAIAVLAALPQVAVAVGATKTPGPIPLLVALPQAIPLAGGGATVVPDPIALLLGIPQATPSVAQGATVVPATIALLADLPQVAAQVGATASPGTIAVVVALPQATGFGEGGVHPGTATLVVIGSGSGVAVGSGGATPGVSGGYAEVDDA
jgi:hypothetical protein